MILDGKLVSEKIKDEAAASVSLIKEKYGKEVCLAVVVVGEDPASLIYVRNKIRACERTGIKSLSFSFSENATQEEVEEKIKELAIDPSVNGILVQLPLPKKFDTDRIIGSIPKCKDVDGLTSASIASLVLDEEGITPCTPKGVMDILDHYNIELKGKRVAIIGRSILVGKPLFFLMTNANATCTLCHSKTLEIEKITKEADIVVCALGKAKFLKKDMVKPGAIVIDVGINRVDGKVVGDADFEELKDIASYITPVPGGCGPMTVAELMKNTVECFLMQEKQ